MSLLEIIDLSKIEEDFDEFFRYVEKYSEIGALYCYAMNIIKGRWPEAEPAIKTDPWYAYHYARDVIKGRWLEAEEIILNSEWEKRYKNELT